MPTRRILLLVPLGLLALESSRKRRPARSAAGCGTAGADPTPPRTRRPPTPLGPRPTTPLSPPSRSRRVCPFRSRRQGRSRPGSRSLPLLLPTTPTPDRLTPAPSVSVPATVRPMPPGPVAPAPAPAPAPVPVRLATPTGLVLKRLPGVADARVLPQFGKYLEAQPLLLDASGAKVAGTADGQEDHPERGRRAHQGRRCRR